MIKLVHVISGLNTGGAEMMLYKLLSVWDRDRDRIEVISLTDVGAIGDRIRDLNVSVRALGMRRGRLGITKLFRLGRWLLQSSPDVVQTWMYHADLVGGLAAKFSGGFPVVWGIRNSTLGQQTRKSTFLTVKLCARLSRWLPTKIVSCSVVSRGIHERMGYNPEKMLVIPNGFDLSSFKPNDEARFSVRNELNLSQDAVLIGFVARFDPQKDHKNFIAATRRVVARHDRVHFVLCGEGVDDTNPHLSRWIQECGVIGRFHLLGRRDDVVRVTASLDIATCPSAYGEAFPNVVGEAMATGVPCVVTDVGDSAFIVGDTGQVVPPRQPEMLAEALNWMIELGAEGRTELGAKARRRIQENFDLSVVRDRYAALYREVVGDGMYPG